MSDVENNERQDSESLDSNRKKKRWSCSIIVTTIIEMIILAILIVLEYFLRFTTKFPIRKIPFSCTDKDISYSYDSLNSEFSFSINVPLEVIYILCLSIPITVILFSELVISAFLRDIQKKSDACKIKFPKAVRRILRFIGVFVFGIVSLMVYIDIIKLMTGRLAPNFLDVCVVNSSICSSQTQYSEKEICIQSDKLKLRHARSSFPSIYTAMSSFSAVFVMIYIHCALKTFMVTILRPFISFIFLLLAILCGLWEIGTYQCHWTDVVVGFAAGSVMAVYLTIVTLDSFKDYSHEDKIVHFFKKIAKEREEENANMQKYKNRNLQRQRVIYSSPRSKWQRAVTSLQDARKNDPEFYNTFQKDLSKGIDHFRDRRQSVID